MDRRPATFRPDAFNVQSFSEAKDLTVGSLDFNDGTYIRGDERWDSDTAYTADFIAEHLGPAANSLILDYGCGTGRISKELIARFGCRMLGADSSLSMLEVARSYVTSSRFLVRRPFDLIGGCCDAAICLWVLQHSGSPRADVGAIHRVLRPHGKLLVFNENSRHVPTWECGWVNDGLDVTAALEAVFGHSVAAGKLDPTRVHWKFSERTFWAIYQKKGNE